MESAPRIVPGTHQKVACTNTGSASSSAVGGVTRRVLLKADQNMHIDIGDTPTATASTFMILPADPPLIIGIAGGQKVAGRCDSAATGNLYVTEVE